MPVPAPAAAPSTAPPVREAVEAFLAGPTQALEDVMVGHLRQAPLLAVVVYDPPVPDGTDTVPAGTTMRFRGKVTSDGGQLLAVYTDEEAVRKDLPGHPVKTTVLGIEQVAAFALHPPNAGAVLNPAGPYLELRAAELRTVLPADAWARLAPTA